MVSLRDSFARHAAHCLSPKSWLKLLAWLSLLGGMCLWQACQNNKGKDEELWLNGKTSSLSAHQPTIRRLLSGQATHRYAFSAQPGQFIQCRLQPNEYGLRYQVYDTNGQVRRTGKTRSFGITTISFVPTMTERFTVRVTAPANLVAPIHYEIGLTTPRATTENDQRQQEAELTVEEAERLSTQETEAPLRQAIQRFEAAEQIWNTLGNQRERGFALLNLGVAHYNLSSETQATQCFQEALRIWEMLGETAGQAEASFELANLAADGGAPSQAEDYYRRAITLWEKMQWRSRLPHVFTASAANQLLLGNWQAALDSYQQAFEIYHQLQNANGEAMTLTGASEAYYQLGDYQQAIDKARQALQMSVHLNSLVRQQMAQSWLGEAYLSAGQPDQALRHFSQALELSRKLGDPRREALALRRVGAAQNVLGETSSALQHYQAALPISQAKNPYEEPTLHNLIGEFHAQRGDYQQAQEHFQQALKRSQQTFNQLTEISVLHNLAQLNRQRGDWQNSRRHSEMAIKLIEARRERIANRQLRESYFATVQKSYSLYVDTLMRQHEQAPQGNLAAQAWQVNEQARARTLREQLIESRVDVRVGLPAALLEREQKLQQELNAKANQLLSAATSAEIEQWTREARELRSRLADLEGQMRQAAPSYAALTQPPPLNLRTVQRELLDEQTALLEYALGDEQSYVWLLTRRGLQAKRLANRRAIETQAHRVYELLTARLAFQTAANQQNNEQSYGARIRQADTEYWQEATKLSNLILPAEWLAELKHTSLLVVSDGALQYLPFSALPVPGTVNENPLLMRFEITHLPSVTVLAELRRQQSARTPRTKLLAVLADPVYNADDDRLNATNSKPTSQTLATTRSSTTPDLQLRAEDGSLIKLTRLLNADNEAEVIRKYAPPEQSLVLKGFAVNRQVLTDPQLSNYSILHFATHGYLNNEHPEFSGLFLSRIQPNGQPTEGLLRMHEIYRLKTPADLVVLSACETALGKEIRGEGLMALTRGFMYAGATRVVASLWKVNDATIPRLMDDFYAGMLKDKHSPAAALRQAQQQMWQNPRTRAPFYWAAFILQGEPRNFSSLFAHSKR